MGTDTLTTATVLETDAHVKRLPWYRFRSPVVQNLICSFVMALTPGIFLCLTNLGAGGGKPSSATFASRANVILYGRLIV